VPRRLHYLLQPRRRGQWPFYFLGFNRWMQHSFCLRSS
jgi:hypothetical protein